jgi:hypothetical protein
MVLTTFALLPAAIADEGEIKNAQIKMVSIFLALDIDIFDQLLNFRL